MQRERAPVPNSAVTPSRVLICARQVPLTVAAFALLPLPMLPPSPPLTARFLVGVLVLMGGLALWIVPGLLPAAQLRAAGKASHKDD